MFLPAAHIFGRAQHVVGVDNGLNTVITESCWSVSPPALFLEAVRAAPALGQRAPIGGLTEFLL